MSKKQVHTNLVGRKIRLTDEASQHAKWHSNEGPLWNWRDVSDPSTAKFVGNYANLPGGREATGEVIAVHLNRDHDVVAGVQWDADGTITPELRIEYLVVVPGESE